MNFQMFKLDLEKLEEPEIKLSTSAGSQKKQQNSRKNIYLCITEYTKPLTVWVTTNWKILQEMGIPYHLICLLRSLHAGQVTTVMDMEKQTASKLGKEFVKAVYCHPAYLTYMQSTSMQRVTKQPLDERERGE